MSRGRADAGRVTAAAGLGALAAVATLVPVPALAGGTVPADPDVVTVAVVDQRFGVVAGRPLTFALDLGGDTAATTPDAVVTLHTAVTDTEQLLATSGGAPGPALDSVTTDLTGVGADSVTVASGLGPPVAADDELTVPAPGVFPVTITVGTGAATATVTTFVAIIDPAAPDSDPTRLVLLAGVDDPGPWPPAGATQEAKERLAEAAALTAAVAGPVSLRVPPTLLTASPPPVPPTGFDRDELLAQPAVPLDPSALAAVAESASFTRQLVSGERASAAAVPLASRTRAVWLADGPLSTAGARLLRDLGVQLVIMPPAVASALGVRAGTEIFPVALGGGDSLAALVISPLGDGLAAPDGDTTAATAAARVMAAVQLRHDRAATPPVLVLATADIGVPDSDVAAAFARYAGELPGVLLVPASDLTGAASRALSSPAAPAPVLLPDSAGADLAPRAAAIDARREDADQARSMLVDPADADAWDADFTRLLARTLDDEEVDAHLAAISAEVGAVLGAVVAPEPFAITLTGTQSDLPLTITNTADQDLQVLVRVRSAKLTTEAPLPVTLPAGQARVVVVPVTARSNGTFTIEVDVVTPLHRRVAGPVAVRGSVRRVTGLSQVVTGGAVLALASWWYSHFRRRRRLNTG